MIDLSHLREWIGREDVVEERLTASLVARHHATMGSPDVIADDDAPAPRLIHFCLCQPCAPAATLGADGHPARGGFLPPVPLPRRMWAGSAIDFMGDLRVGDTVRRTSRIADVAVKEGRSSILCFVTVEHEVAGSGGVAVRERQTIVYRDAAAGPPPDTPPPAPDGAIIVAVEPSTTLLFRYSALTFNAHRIHYDRDYATGVEGYPGLVVHGPLQATWLYRFATRLRGRAPAHFTFRGVSPLFDHDAIALHAGPIADDAMSLWTARTNGPVAMQAEARWR